MRKYFLKIVIILRKQYLNYLANFTSILNKASWHIGVSNKLGYMKIEVIS